MQSGSDSWQAAAAESSAAAVLPAVEAVEMGEGAGFAPGAAAQHRSCGLGGLGIGGGGWGGGQLIRSFTLCSVCGTSV